MGHFYGNMGLLFGKVHSFGGNSCLFLREYIYICFWGNVSPVWEYMSLVRDCGSFWKIIKAFS